MPDCGDHCGKVARKRTWWVLFPTKCLAKETPRVANYSPTVETRASREPGS
jgi:hypothetical protein